MKLIRADYMVIIGLLMILVAHATTNYLINSYQDVATTVGIAEDVVLLMEVNPIARWFFSLDAFNQIYSYILVPTVLIGFYYVLRRKYANDIFVLEAYALAFMALALLDASNDVSILLGFLASGG